VKRFARRLVAASALLVFSHVTPLGAQTPDAKLGALADELARGIEKIKFEGAAKNQATTFLVFSIQEASGPGTQLGIHLADELSQAVSSRSRKIKAVAPADLRALIELEHLDPAVFQQEGVAVWAAATLGADLAVVGTMERGTDAIHLKIRAIGKDPKNMIDLGSRDIDWTDGRRALQEQAVQQTPPASPWKDVPSAEAPGYSRPNCYDCPQPPYSEGARMARFSGTATVLLLVGQDGSVREVRLEHGLPCDLNYEISNALKDWRFQPITGPDGKAAVVQVKAQVSFHLQ